MNTNINNNAQSYDAMVKQASQKNKSAFSLSKTYPAFIALIAGLALSYIAFDFVSKSTQASLKNDFDKAISSAMTRFESAALSNEQTLNSFKTLYNDRVEVVRDVFELYASVPTKTYPYLLTLSWSKYIKESDLSIHTFNIRSQGGNYEYAVHPAGSRERYLPIDFLVPMSKTLNGLDLYTFPQIKTSVDRAFASGNIASTVSFDRRKDSLCFYLIQPIYSKDVDINNEESRKNRALGVITLEIETNKFFKFALGEGVASDATIIFEIIDDNNKVFNSTNSDLLNSGYTPYFKEEKSLKIGDRNLTVKFVSVPNYGGKLQTGAPYIALGIGIIISFSLFGFILSVLTARTRAMDLAERMTRSQRRIVDSSSDIIAVMDLNGLWKSMNPASQAIFKLSPESLIGANIGDLVIEKENVAKFTSSIENALDESIVKLDMLMKSGDEEKWLSWSFTVSKTDGLIYAIGRDVTHEKLAEEQAKLRSKQIRIAEQFALEASESKSYFMTKLSHQLRNALTGIMGYLELLSNRMFDNDDEFDSFVMLANESSEELFTTVTDIIDVAIGAAGAKYSEPTLVKLKDAIDESIKEIKTTLVADELSREVSIIFDEGENSHVIADFSSIVRALQLLSLALTENLENSEIRLVAQENQFEGATDIQILAPPNALAHKMISVYKSKNANIIEALESDSKDVLYKFARAASLIRRMNGSITIESFGENDENLVAITLPLNKAAL